MAPLSPAILPITNPQTISAGESQPPVATPAFRAFINNITETVRSGLSQRSRPWSEFANRSSFSRPVSLTDVATRIQKNYSYFRSNYLTVVAGVLRVFLLTNPFSLLAVWLFLYLFRPSDQPLRIFGRTFSDGETLGLLTIFSIGVILFTSVVHVVVSTLLVGIVIVCAHGAFRTPEDLFLEEHEAAMGGICSTSEVRAEALNGFK